MRVPEMLEALIAHALRERYELSYQARRGGFMRLRLFVTLTSASLLAGAPPALAQQKPSNSEKTDTIKKPLCTRQDQVDELLRLQAELIKVDESTRQGHLRGDQIRNEIERVKSLKIDRCQPIGDKDGPKTTLTYFNPSTGDYRDFKEGEQPVDWKELHPPPPIDGLPAGATVTWQSGFEPRPYVNPLTGELRWITPYQPAPAGWLQLHPQPPLAPVVGDHAQFSGPTKVARSYGPHFNPSTGESFDFPPGTQVPPGWKPLEPLPSQVPGLPVGATATFTPGMEPRPYLNPTSGEQRWFTPGRAPKDWLPVRPLDKAPLIKSGLSGDGKQQASLPQGYHPAQVADPQREGRLSSAPALAAAATTEPRLSVFERQVLDAQNAARARYAVPPLKWNFSLAEHAAAWAGQLARVGQLVHAPREGRGIERENLQEGLIGWAPLRFVQDWLAEEKHFHSGVFPDVCDVEVSQCLHWTQVIWPTTTDVGCAVAEGGERAWFVCRYSPGGNRDGTLVGRSAPTESDGG